jgi:membrane protein DedA with SNARE-associated domain
MAWPRFLFFNAAGAVVWATLYGVGYYVFGSALEKLSTTIDITLGVAGVVLLVAFIVWTKRKEDELLARAENEIEGSVEEELGAKQPGEKERAT